MVLGPNLLLQRTDSTQLSTESFNFQIIWGFVWYNFGILLDNFGIILVQAWNHFGIVVEKMLGLFWDHYFGIVSVRGTKFGSSGEPGSGGGGPVTTANTIRFSIRTVRTPQASLVQENKLTVSNPAKPYGTNV